MSAADLPKFEDLMLPVLELIQTGHQTVSDCLPALQTRFGLTDGQMEELLPSGKQTTISNRTHWARNYMKHAGLVEAVSRGRYRITPLGEQLLAQGRARIDKPVLEQFPLYQAWRSRQAGEAEAAAASVAAPLAAATPEEHIETAYAQLDAALAEDLLEQVLALTPARFERLIVELLLAMGYGDGRTEMGQAIGKSGDGGIDGVVNEDKLGLDAVYIQAKRYGLDNVVGRPALQAFIGSMTGESATKGVFVTTSSFSREAREYVRRVQQRVVLIDGARLARLMIDHGVGVRIDKTYVLRSIDANFFDVD
ncbi:MULTISPECIES: restriction endonuclease [Paracoccus]|uniref:restriction endonuclease n=1 Tax=Paracoccus TaxID=265 RepID=UPI001FB5F273|nr:restriction endonuclease [Paracoccus sp. AS002]MCJ1900477.1 restriction endonuclease [Paracoccus versutus]MDF3906030.1 restriction endonuclease [Paracoccus sp. AS002]